MLRRTRTRHHAANTVRQAVASEFQKPGLFLFQNRSWFDSGRYVYRISLGGEGSIYTLYSHGELQMHRPDRRTWPR
jgi:hypothetical protein